MKSPVILPNIVQMCPFIVQFLILRSSVVSRRTTLVVVPVVDGDGRGRLRGLRLVAWVGCHVVFGSDFHMMIADVIAAGGKSGRKFCRPSSGGKGAVAWESLYVHQIALNSWRSVEENIDRRGRDVRPP